MDITIFRKPETKYEHTFEQVVQMCKEANANGSYQTMNYICENFPKNCFMRVGPNGMFNFYCIRNNGEISYNGKCYANLNLVEDKWAICKNLDDVFCALDYDTGTKVDLAEVRRNNVNKHTRTFKRKGVRRNRGNYPPFPSVHPEIDEAKLKTEEVTVGEPLAV